MSETVSKCCRARVEYDEALDEYICQECGELCRCKEPPEPKFRRRRYWRLRCLTK